MTTEPDFLEEAARGVDGITALMHVTDEGQKGNQAGLQAVAEATTAGHELVAREIAASRDATNGVGALLRVVTETVQTLKGKDGKDGTDGTTGPAGHDGPPGADGSDGADGQAGKSGIDGKDGKDGAAGRDGAQGRQGDKGLNWRGPYDGRVAYQPDDAMEFQGSSYVATEPIRGLTPPGNGWDLLARRGVQGPSGGSSGGGGVALSNAIPLVESGSGAAGSGTKASKDDHVHPADGGGGGGGSDDQTAAEVPFDNTVAALPGSPTNVQAAIEEVAAEAGTGTLAEVLTAGNDGGGLGIVNPGLIRGTDAVGGYGASLELDPANGGGGAAVVQGGSGTTGSPGGAAVLSGGAGDGGIAGRDPAIFTAYGGTTTGNGYAQVRTDGSYGTAGQFLGSDGLDNLVWAVPAGGLPPQWTDGGNGDVTATTDDDTTPITVIAPEAGFTNDYAIRIEPAGDAWTGGILISTGVAADLTGSAYAIRVMDEAGAQVFDVDAFGSMALTPAAGTAGGSANFQAVNHDPVMGLTLGVDGPSSEAIFAAPVLVQHRFTIARNSAPADGDVIANRVDIWFDPTDGAASPMWKGKQADGTVVSGSLGGGAFTPATDPGDIADPTLATPESNALKINALLDNMRTAGMLA